MLLLLLLLQLCSAIPTHHPKLSASSLSFQRHAQLPGVSLLTGALAILVGLEYLGAAIIPGAVVLFWEACGDGQAAHGLSQLRMQLCG